VTADRNRSRWPVHELWRAVTEVVGEGVNEMRSGVVLDEVKTANREEHKRMLDTQILGLLISRAAAEGIRAGEVERFMLHQVHILREKLREHPVPLDERLEKAKARYRFR